MARRSVATLGCFLALAACGVHAAGDTELLWQFAKANENKFSSEITGRMPTVVVPTARWTLDLGGARYDQERSRLVLDMPPTLRNAWVEQACKRQGTYVGRNAFGAQAVVEVQSCVRLELTDSGDGLELANYSCPTRQFAETNELTTDQIAAGCAGLGGRRLVIPMTPAEYRAIKRKDSARLEMRVDVGQGAEQEVVLKQSVTGTPKVDDPFERRIKIWNVIGKFLGARIVSQDGKSVLAEIGATAP